MSLMVRSRKNRRKDDKPLVVRSWNPPGRNEHDNILNNDGNHHIVADEQGNPIRNGISASPVRRHTTGNVASTNASPTASNTTKNQWSGDNPCSSTSYPVNPKHVLDRFGFIINIDSHGNLIDSPLPPPSTTDSDVKKRATSPHTYHHHHHHYKNSRMEVPPTHAESLRTERRIKKWFTMIHSWTPFVETLRTKRRRRYKTVVRRSRKGIPDSERGKIWPILCGVGLKIRDNPGLYADLVHRSVILPTSVTDDIDNGTIDYNNDDQVFPVKLPVSSIHPETTPRDQYYNTKNETCCTYNHSKSFRSIQETIERDIHRTYPRHAMFIEETFSNHNTSISENNDDFDDCTKDCNKENVLNQSVDENGNSDDDDDDNDLPLNEFDSSGTSPTIKNILKNNHPYDEDDIISNLLQKEVTTNGLCGTTAEDITNAFRQQLDLTTTTAITTSTTTTGIAISTDPATNDAVETIATSPISSASSSLLLATTAPNGDGVGTNTSDVQQNLSSTSSKKNTKQMNSSIVTDKNNTSVVSSSAATISSYDNDCNVKPEIVLHGRGGQAAMRRVLKAYSTYDRQTGYCQGMNFIVGMFLTIMTEEEAFWMLVVIMFEKPCKMRGMFGEGMKETHCALYVAEKLIYQFVPNLAKHFEKEMIHITMFATQWLLTVYTSSFHFDLVTRVWDSFLIEGWKTTYRIMLSILHYYQNDLLKMSFEEILVFFRTLPETIHGTTIVEYSIVKIPLKTIHIAKYEMEWQEQQRRQLNG